MLALTCSKCGRRFMPNAEEVQGYLDQSEGKKHALVLCPHCGKGNKVDVQRLHQMLRFNPAPVKAAEETEEKEPGPEGTPQATAKD